MTVGSLLRLTFRLPLRLHGAAPLALAVLFALTTAMPAAAEGRDVDLALVIAVDVSYSMDPEEQELQRQGFVEAFRSPVVHDAIRRGTIGRIAVTYMEWSGVDSQKVIVPWTAIEDAEGAVAFAEELAQQPTRRLTRTSISGAIDFSVKLLAESGFAATRRVVDVSGDGANNSGRPVTEARDEAVAAGITINGLPIMLKAPGPHDIVDLDLYYSDCVIGGTGAFMVPARQKEQFIQVVKAKIILEIADTRAAMPLLHRTQAPERRANCLAGETQWRKSN